MDSLSVGHWKKIADSSSPNAPEERTGHALALHQDILYLIGGVNSKSACLPMSIVDGLDFKSGQWHRKFCTGEAPSTRSSMQNVELSSRGLYLFFGGYYVEEYFNDAYLLDLSSFEWKKISSGMAEISKRSYFSMVFDGESTYIYGGRNRTDIFDDLYKIAYVSDSKKLIIEPIVAIGDKPSEMFGHTAVISKRSM
jgi:N-acetylneuraminic acid mutarotase